MHIGESGQVVLMELLEMLVLILHILWLPVVVVQFWWWWRRRSKIVIVRYVVTSEGHQLKHLVVLFQIGAGGKTIHTLERTIWNKFSNPVSLNANGGGWGGGGGGSPDNGGGGIWEKLWWRSRGGYW